VTQEAGLAPLMEKLGAEKVIHIVTLALALTWYADASMGAPDDRARTRLYVTRLYEGLQLVQQVFDASSLDIGLRRGCTTFTDQYFADKVEAAGPPH
jgi:hypothetical protein